MIRDFLKFIKDFNVVSLAVGFIMGTASSSLIKSFVSDIIMPIIQPLMTGSWQTAVLNIGPVHIAYGLFLSELINFLLLALIIFIFAHKLLKMEVHEKK